MQKVFTAAILILAAGCAAAAPADDFQALLDARGDELYGDATNADRLMLHASMLTIHHPRTGKQMTFKASDPF